MDAVCRVTHHSPAHAADQEQEINFVWPVERCPLVRGPDKGGSTALTWLDLLLEFYWVLVFKIIVYILLAHLQPHPSTADIQGSLVVNACSSWSQPLVPEIKPLLCEMTLLHVWMCEIHSPRSTNQCLDITQCNCYQMLSPGGWHSTNSPWPIVLLVQNPPLKPTVPSNFTSSKWCGINRK